MNTKRVATIFSGSAVSASRRASTGYPHIAAAFVAAAFMLIAGSARAQWTITPAPQNTSGSLCIENTGGPIYVGGNTPPYGDCADGAGNRVDTLPDPTIPTTINFGTGSVTATTLSDGMGTTITGGVVTTNSVTVTGQSNLNGGATVSNNLTVNPGTAVSMGGNRVQNVAAPVASTDAVTKGYVDAGLAGMNASINQLAKRIEENTEGIAIAIALGGLALPQGKTFAIGASLGLYDDKKAISAQTALRLDEAITLIAGVGVGFDEGNVGGRVGISSAF